MPQVFKIGSYWVYFWLDENLPLEPIHVHISQGKPVPNGTKVWITKNHRCSLAHNKSKIPPATLNNIIRIIEMRIPEIEQKWMSTFYKNLLAYHFPLTLRSNFCIFDSHAAFFHFCISQIIYISIP